MMRIALILSLALVACGPTPPPPQQAPQSYLAAPELCPRACVRLAMLDCPEGADADRCARVCSATEGVKAFRHSAACIVAAVDVAAVRSCGVRCAP